MNVSTSSQLAVVVPDDKGNIFTGELPSKAVKCLPFFQGKKVMTAASLSGWLSCLQICQTWRAITIGHKGNLLFTLEN